MKYLLPLAFAANIVNLFAFVVVAHRLGGDAINGKVEHGHYFLSSHGRLTEVSANVFAYSRVHATSLLVTFPIGMLAGVCLVFWAMEHMRNVK